MRHKVEQYAWGSEAQAALSHSGFCCFTDGQVHVDGAWTCSLLGEEEKSNMKVDSSLLRQLHLVHGVQYTRWRLPLLQVTQSSM